VRQRLSFNETMGFLPSSDYIALKLRPRAWKGCNVSLILQEVLAPEDLQRVRAELDSFSWDSGKRTAGAAARAVKENLQASGSDPKVQALERFVAEALRRHPLFEIAARPKRLTRLMFSRYEPGMTYGNHTDDALMGPSDDKLRTDLAFTIFLADRESYDGGALVVETALGEQEIALDAGDAILYPAGSIHHVAPVTRGARLAAVGWVESFVADAGRREILFDLSVARERLAGAGAPREEVLRLDKAISNLLRMWAR
jgi:PKHD-type hydroxylase